MPGNQFVRALQLDPQGGTVVYRADGDVPGEVELYSVPSDGSAPPVQLNPPLVAGGDVEALQITADSARVVYRADQELDGRLGLRVVPGDGSTSPVRLSAALAPGGDVSAFSLAPDGSRVVYLADQRVAGVSEPFVVPADGSGPAMALDTLASFADVFAFQIDPDSQRRGGQGHPRSLDPGGADAEPRAAEREVTSGPLMTLRDIPLSPGLDRSRLSGEDGPFY